MAVPVKIQVRAGTKSIAEKYEAVSAMITTAGSDLANSPASPGRAIRGAKAAIVVSVDEKTGLEVSSAPSMEALAGSMFSSSLTCIASVTTIELSTKIPRDIMRAAIEI